MNDVDFNDPEDIKKEWSDLLHRWSGLNRRRFDQEEITTEEHSALLREWWKTTSKVLWLLVRAENAGNAELTPMPVALLSEVARMAADLGNGRTSPMLQGVTKQGRSTYSLSERRQISTALNYLAAVREGRIVDRSPNKSVRTAFDVSDQTVRDWESRRDEIIEDMPPAPQTEKMLRHELMHAADLYRVNGRGLEAINRKKRKFTDT